MIRCFVSTTRLCALLGVPLTAQSTQFVPIALPANVTAGVNTADMGDIDHDGDLDFVVFEWLAGLRILTNNGLAGFSSVTVPYAASSFGSVTVPVFVDFDGDGDQDIACTGLAIIGGHNQMLVNGGGGVFTSVEPFPGFFSLSIDAADIDGDGDLDLAVSEVAPRLWRNDGAMAFTDITSTHLPVLPSTASQCTFGDVDGDGDVDLFVGGTAASGDRVLLNDGTGILTELPGAAPQGLGGTQSSALRDVDEDGDVDLIRGTSFHGLTVARNDGSGVFTNDANAFPPGTAGIRALRVGDFDGGQDLDVFAHELGSALRLFANQHRHLRQTAPPQIGQPWTVSVVSQPGYPSAPRSVLVGIAWSHLSQPLSLPPIGTLWLDLSAPLLFIGSVLPIGVSVLPFVVPVPPMPAIVGLEVHAQALLQELPGTLGVRLTPMLTTTIQ